MNSYAHNEKGQLPPIVGEPGIRILPRRAITTRRTLCALKGTLYPIICVKTKTGKYNLHVLRPYSGYPPLVSSLPLPFPPPSLFFLSPFSVLPHSVFLSPRSLPLLSFLSPVIRARSSQRTARVKPLHPHTA